MRVSFDEKDYAKSRKYTLEIPLKAAYINDVEAEAVLSAGTFSLKIGGREYGAAESFSSRAKISRSDVNQAP